MFYTRLLAFVCTLAFLFISWPLGCGKNDDSTGPGSTVPILTTSSVSAITETSAECGGNISSDGGAPVTARGVCWCTGQAPTTANETTNDGTGTGAFTSSITGLNHGITYYVRAYAINSVGIGYGDIDSFTTVAYGTIIIDATPDSINASWSLSGPDSYSTNGTGDDTLTDLKAGDYMVSWGVVSGWITPSDSSETLAVNDTVTFAGIYMEETTGTVTDIDGNVYQTIKIGNQWWMMENLKAIHYSSGESIPNVTDDSIWKDLTTGAYCNYGDNESYVPTYGRLYNWYAVYDDRNIAPAGWHVPSDADWKQLEMYLGMSQADADAYNWRGTDEGGKLKEAGTAHWVSPNTGATNESGFTALPGGYRDFDANYGSMGYGADFWSSTEYSGHDAWFRLLGYNRSVSGRFVQSKQYGISVRCVKD